MVGRSGLVVDKFEIRLRAIVRGSTMSGKVGRSPISHTCRNASRVEHTLQTVYEKARRQSLFRTLSMWGGASATGAIKVTLCVHLPPSSYTSSLTR